MIYLDSAATTLQKPSCVFSSMMNAAQNAASPGRGGHIWGKRAAEIAYSCREEAAKLFNVRNPEQIVFAFNATHGLNIAIRSLVKPGMTVLISGYEHNAVTRPLKSIPNVTVRIASAEPFDREGILCAFADELSRGVDVVICNHVSNVFGFILPIEALALLCRRFKIPLIIDASQSAGCVPIDFTALGAQFVAMPGHKGLYGPPGTGLLLCAGEAEPVLYGGTGSLSALQEMPDFLPDRLEAGTPNTPGIAGLMAGIRFVSRTGVKTIGRHERVLTRKFGRLLSEQKGVRMFLSPDPALQTGVLSFIIDGADCEGVGKWLGERGIAVRAGLHCAPAAHKSAGTLASGTVRASVSCFNTERDVEYAAYVISQYRR